MNRVQRLGNEGYYLTLQSQTEKLVVMYGCMRNEPRLEDDEQGKDEACHEVHLKNARKKGRETKTSPKVEETSSDESSKRQRRLQL